MKKHSSQFEIEPIAVCARRISVSSRPSYYANKEQTQNRRSETDPLDLMSGVSASLRRLFESLAKPISRAADLERALAIDNPLASRLWRLAIEQDPVLAVSLLPTINQIRGAIRAAGKAGANEAATLDALRSVDVLDRFIQTHAGNMAQFEAIVVREAGPYSGESLALKHRRAAFRANCQVWGRQAKIASASAVTIPETGDLLGVRGLISFQVTQPIMAVEVRAGIRVTPSISDDPAAQAVTRQITPPTLVPGFGEGPPPQVVEDLGNLPEFASVQFHLAGRGKENASSFFFHQFASNTESRNFPESSYGVQMIVCYPVELLHLDLWVPHERSDPSTCRIGTFANATSPERGTECREADSVEMYAHASQFLGVTDPPPVTDIPQWSKVIEHVFREHGLAGKQFDVYRCRVRYPILHSVIDLRVDSRSPTG